MEKTLTESEKIEQLMRPRWRVIGPYPYSPYKEGDLIKVTDHDSFHITTTTIKDEFGEIHFCENFVPISRIERFPNLFKRLSWWEERTPEEMPLYVKDEATGKVLMSEYNMQGHTPCDVKTWSKNEPPFWNTLHDLVPATESEYNEYLTHPSRLTGE